MTNEELAELERLLANATPGKWVFDGDWARRPCINAGPKEVAQIYKKGFPARDDHRPDEAANAALIVALRNAAPSLIATAREAEALRAENARLREAAGNNVGPDDPAQCPGKHGVSCCGWHDICRAALEQGEV